MATTGFLPVPGARLYFEVSGDGFPVVLVHSRWLNSALWDPQVPALLAAHYQVIRYDMRGFGRSEMETPYSDTSDLLALFEHLRVEQAHLVGISMGAELVIDFALSHLARVRSLVVVGAGTADFEGYSQDMWDAENRFLEAVKADDYEQATQRVIDMWIAGPGRTAEPTVEARARQLMAGHTFRRDKPRPQTGSEHEPPEADAGQVPPDERERLGRLRLPVLVMVGEHDWPEQVQMAERLAGYLPQAEHLVVPGAAHVVALDQPDAFTRALLDFLARH